MMKTPSLILCGFVLLAQSNNHAQEVYLQLESTEAGLTLTHETVADAFYELQQSSDLVNWESMGPATAGDGQLASLEFVPMADICWFFRLVITEAPVGLAPTEAEAAALFVGTNWEGYAFSSATRYCWRNECGNWSYEKTGPDTALIVFTYDEDNNNPDIYREEVVLTFTTSTSGQYRYSEFWYGVEDPGSVGMAPFQL